MMLVINLLYQVSETIMFNRTHTTQRLIADDSIARAFGFAFYFYFSNSFTCHRGAGGSLI
jgi:hypothetical protein